MKFEVTEQEINIIGMALNKLQVPVSEAGVVLQLLDKLSKQAQEQQQETKK